MQDGRYIVEYVTQTPLNEERLIRIGEYEVEHDYIVEVDGPELEDELQTGPVTHHVEDLLERAYNNGYYRTRRLDTDDPDNSQHKRRPPTWSAV